ncbi:hypothetical protein Poly59_17250 [Rubripirellula reticaptiva]|uniref:Uncharacterized protein n=1 Tax=Rubripirellula reticaptiva TaxID=2528013 RepID=A0A5C6F4Q0_9BACT|nr:hypothetical protein Poly59_17250 [Rubripirellula reticaptiva]
MVARQPLRLPDRGWTVVLDRQRYAEPSGSVVHKVGRRDGARRRIAACSQSCSRGLAANGQRLGTYIDLGPSHSATQRMDRVPASSRTTLGSATAGKSSRYTATDLCDVPDHRDYSGGGFHTAPGKRCLIDPAPSKCGWIQAVCRRRRISLESR